MRNAPSGRKREFLLGQREKLSSELGVIGGNEPTPYLLVHCDHGVREKSAFYLSSSATCGQNLEAKSVITALLGLVGKSHGIAVVKDDRSSERGARSDVTSIAVDPVDI
jgi:hypothetical protein